MDDVKPTNSDADLPIEHYFTPAKLAELMEGVNGEHKIMTWEEFVAEVHADC